MWGGPGGCLGGAFGGALGGALGVGTWGSGGCLFLGPWEGGFGPLVGGGYPSLRIPQGPGGSIAGGLARKVQYKSREELRIETNQGINKHNFS